MSETSKRRQVSIFASRDSSSNEPLYVVKCSGCGQLVYILRNPLQNLPKRRTYPHDFIVIPNNLVAERAVPSAVKLIRRKSNQTVERQSRLSCPKCDIFVGYRCGENNPNLFLFSKAVSSSPSSLNQRAEGFIHSIENPTTKEEAVRIYICVSKEVSNFPRFVSIKDDFIIACIQHPESPKAAVINSELIHLVSSTLDVDINRISIVSDISRVKELQINGISLDFAQSRLISSCSGLLDQKN